MPGFIGSVEDENNIIEQCIGLGEIEEDFVCDNCGLRFSMEEYNEDDKCPECNDGDLVTIN